MIDQSKSHFYTLNGEINDDTIQMVSSAVEPKIHLAPDLIIDQKYRIVSLLGEGGMGVVYKAHHLLLDKEVALKTFKSPNMSEESWHRFRREAQAIGRLNHANIVQLFDFGAAENGVPYYTMECLSGRTLADKIAFGGAQPVDWSIKIFLQVCQGLALAHAKGIIHRDLKPANIFLTDDSTNKQRTVFVKIVDFGIATLASASEENQKLTTLGSVFGSPLYMSPEQSLGKEATMRSDIYSCGCALFETLTGMPPFRGENAFATMLMHQQAEPPALRDVCKESNFSDALQALLDTMLAKKSFQRFASFDEVTLPHLLSHL